MSRATTPGTQGDPAAPPGSLGPSVPEIEQDEEGSGDPAASLDQAADPDHTQLDQLPEATPVAGDGPPGPPPAAQALPATANQPLGLLPPAQQVPLALNTSGLRTPVDLTCPSPGPQPEVQVLEPEQPSSPASPGSGSQVPNLGWKMSSATAPSRQYSSDISTGVKATRAAGLTSTSSQCPTANLRASERRG